MKRIITLIELKNGNETIPRQTVLDYEIKTLNSYLVKIKGKLVPIPIECAELLDKNFQAAENQSIPNIKEESKGAMDGSALPAIIININGPIHVNNLDDVDKIVKRITRTFNASLKKLR